MPKKRVITSLMICMENINKKGKDSVFEPLSMCLLFVLWQNSHHERREQREAGAN